MIYTVTLNPSLDFVMDVAHFERGAINRSSGEMLLPGGKGINVSQVLNELSVENTALYFAAGFTGEKLSELLRAAQIRSRAIRLDAGMTRINVKIRAEEETAVNAAGPPVPPEKLALLYQILEGVGEGDTLVFSGNVPASLPDTVYSEMAAIVRKQKAKFVLDAAGKALLQALGQSPWFIKPNHEELAEILGEEVGSPAKALKGARLLQEKGALMVLVSMGEEGALLLGEDGRAFLAENPRGRVRNTVGAGDAMAAGFLAGILSGAGPEEALRLGTAAGSATAFSDGLASRDEIEALRDKVSIRELRAV